MARISNLTFLNNFSIETANDISAEKYAYDVIPCELSPSYNNKEFALTLSNPAGTLFEVAHAKYLTTTSAGVSGFELWERGKEGAVQAWPAGSRVYCSLTAGMLSEIVYGAKDLDEKVDKIDLTLKAYVLEVHFLFDTPRNGTQDKVTMIRGEVLPNSSNSSPESLYQCDSPNNLFEYDDDVEALVLGGTDTKKARIILTDFYGTPSTSGKSQYMKISVKGARPGYSGPCETAQPCTIRIVANGTVFGEEIVTWPAKGATAEYHIEYQNY